MFKRVNLSKYITSKYMSRVVRKPAFCICENKDEDQLRGSREADQRLCFRYTDSSIPLLPTSEIQVSSHLLWLYSPVCVGPGRKPRRPVFSQRGSYIINRPTSSEWFVPLEARNTTKKGNNRLVYSDQTYRVQSCSNLWLSCP